MATKTFEELKQLAIQIRDEKTNKQNTATRVGTAMLEHINKLEQDYYDKTQTDEELKERDDKLTELEQKTIGILEKSAEATQGKALQIVQNGFWAKGTVLKLSLNSDDAQISAIAFGVMYPNGEVTSVVTPSMNKVGEYTLTDYCTRIRVYAGTVSQSGAATMKIETNGLKQRISKIESTLYENITENTKSVTGNTTDFFVSGFWYKGTKLYLSLNSDEAVFNNAYWGVTYPTGEVQSVVITKQNKVGEYILTDDCTKIRVYADGFSTQGNVTLKVETGAITTRVGNIENQVEQLNEDVQLLKPLTEKLENTVYGKIYEKSAEVTQGNALSIVQNGYWKRGTVLKLSVNSDDAQVSSIAFGVMYPSGEELSVATPNMNKVGEYTLTDECTRIRVYVGYVSKSGTVTMKIQTNGLDKRVTINGGSLSILGDSYSTYGLWIPEKNSVWYGINGEDGNNSQTNDVNSVTQTWWYKLCKKLGVSLMLNESYSGSTICNTGYSGGDASATSFIHRMIESIGQGNALKPKPNIIILFGGTNDSWANSPLGEIKYSEWTEDDLKNVLPAICYMFYYVQKWNPGSLILNIVNTDLKTDIVNGFREASEYYGIHNIELVYIEKQSGHPSINGMESICNQIYEYIVDSSVSLQ